MKIQTWTALDDGQPLVEFAPLKPAEFVRDRGAAGLTIPGSVVLQKNVGVAR